MLTSHQAPDFSEHDCDTFEEAVREALEDQGFRELPRPADKTWLWQHDQAEMTVLGVTRDRDRWSEPSDDPVDKAVLLVGGSSTKDRMYLFEDAIWCWCEEWNSPGLRQRLAICAEQANDCVDGRDVPEPEMISFREMLSLAADAPSRPDLERRFSPEAVESTLQELSAARDQFLVDLRG